MNESKELINKERELDWFTVKPLKLKNIYKCVCVFVCIGHVDHMRTYKCGQLLLSKWVINCDCAVLRCITGTSQHITGQSCDNL